MGSDENLQHDKFFHDSISASSDGWLCVDLVMACKKIQSLGAYPADVIAALEESELEVREDGFAIRRYSGRPLPLLQASKAHGANKMHGKGGRHGAQGRAGKGFT